MQWYNPYPNSLPDASLGQASGSMDYDTNNTASGGENAETNRFEGDFSGQMEMMADAASVAEYLDDHQAWFRRCAAPMQVESISENGYALTIGRYGALGYEVEPKIGLHLLPGDHGIYRIETIPLADYAPQVYEVDFEADLALTEHDSEDAPTQRATQVKWHLHLQVDIQFPRFIRALPQGLVKTSGDQLLNQIVRQVSKGLTRKVQEDFHQVKGLQLPKSYHRHRFWSGWNAQD